MDLSHQNGLFWAFWPFLSFSTINIYWLFFVFFTAKKMSFTWMIIGAYFRINFILKFSWWIRVTKTGTKTAFFGLSPVTSIFVTATSTATATGSVLFRVQGWAWKNKVKRKKLGSMLKHKQEIYETFPYWSRVRMSYTVL